MKKQPTAPIRAPLVNAVRKFAAGGPTDVHVSAETGATFRVVTELAVPIEADDNGDSTWYLDVAEEHYPLDLALDEPPAAHGGVSLVIRQGWHQALDGEHEFKRALDVRDLRALFVGLDALRTAMQKHGFDV